MQNETSLIHPLLPPKGVWRNIAVCFLVAAPFLYAALGVYQGQEIGFDFRQYHWYNAYALATGRYFANKDLMPSGVQFFFNPLLDVPFYELATHWSLKGAVFVRGLVQGLNGWMLFFLAYLTLPIKSVAEKTAVAIVCAVLGMTGAMMIAQAGASFDDTLVSLFILLPMVLLLRASCAFAALPWRTWALYVFLAGIPAGAITGLKLTGAAYCVGLCACVLLATPAFKKNVALAFFCGLGMVAGFAATYGFWGYYLYAHYDSPFFPLFNNIFKSPYFVPEPFVQDYTLHKGNPLFYPFAFTFGHTDIVETVWWDFRFLSFYVLAFLAMAKMYVIAFLGKSRADARARKPAAIVMAFAMAVVSYVLWLLAYRTYRYLLPLEMLSPLLSFLCLHYLLPQAKKTKVALCAALACFVLASIHVPYYGRKAVWTPVTDLSSFTLPKKEPVMVLMGGISSYAHTLMAFPAQSSFVRIDGTLFPATKPKSKKDDALRMKGVTRQRIEDYKGAFVWFAPRTVRPRREDILKAYGLAVSGACQTVTDKMAESAHKVSWIMLPRWYDLCPVKRIAPITKP